MFIEELYLKNFGIIKEETISFNKGIYVFSGNNGEGKSTFLKAISLLIFNKIPGKLEDYINWDSDSAIVSMKFNHNKHEYFASMEIVSGSASRKLEDLTTGDSWDTSSSVTQKLEDIFEIKRALASIVSFEQEVDLITTSPAERREYLKNIYDLRFIRELSRIDSDKEDAEKESKEFEIKLTSCENQEFNYEDLLRPLLSEDKKNEILSEIEKFDEFIQKSKLNISLLNEKISSIAAIENEILKLKKSLNLEKSKIEEISKSITDKENDLIDLEKSEFDSKSFEEEIIKIDNLIDSYKEKIKLSEEKLSLLEIDETDYSQELDSLKEKRTQIESEIKILKNTIEKFGEGICPTCGQSVVDIQDPEKNEESLINFSKEIEIITEKINNITIKKGDQKTQLENFRNLENEISRNSLLLKSTEDSRENKIQSKESSIKEFEKNKESQIKSSNEMIQTLKTSVKEGLERISTIESEVSVKTDLLVDVSDLEETISKEKESVSQMENFKKESLLKIEENQKILTSNEVKKKRNEELKAKEENNKENIKKYRSLYEEAEKRKLVCENSKKILTRDFPTFVLSRAISRIEGAVNEFLQKVYPKYEIQIKESKNALRVVYGEKETDVKLASGFERQVFSFAYKYALGRLQNYNILILDEIDSAASEDNSQLFYETIAKMNDMFEQIIIITHKSNTKELLCNDFSATVFEISSGKIAS